MAGTDAITGADIGFILMMIFAIAGAWWRVETAIGKAKSDTIMRAEAAIALASLNSKELAEHKLHVAETYITKQGLREVRDEIMGGVRDLKNSVDHLNERMDRVIENQPDERPSRAQRQR